MIRLQFFLFQQEYQMFGYMCILQFHHIIVFQMGRLFSKPKELTPEEAKRQLIYAPQISDEELMKRHMQYTEMVLEKYHASGQEYLRTFTYECLDQFHLGLVFYFPKNKRAIFKVQAIKRDKNWSYRAPMTFSKRKTPPPKKIQNVSQKPGSQKNSSIISESAFEESNRSAIVANNQQYENAITVNQVLLHPLI